MTRLSGKVVETRSVSPGDENLVLGRRLQRLRNISGVTQCELAVKLNISQAALSKLENRVDVHVSTVRQYVEALGAKLYINAAFSSESAVGFHILNAFDPDGVDDNQLVLPIYGDEDFRRQRDVVLSIKPQYSSKILTGNKTVELRRRFPLKVPAGTLAFIYSTSPEKALVGCAQILSVTKSKVHDLWRTSKDDACISKADFDDYFNGQEFGFALRFGKVKSFKEALNLDVLRDRFEFEAPQSFLYAKPLLREALKHELAELSDRH